MVELDRIVVEHVVDGCQKGEVEFALALGLSAIVFLGLEQHAEVAVVGVGVAHDLQNDAVGQVAVQVDLPELDDHPPLEFF